MGGESARTTARGAYVKPKEDSFVGVDKVYKRTPYIKGKFREGSHELRGYLPKTYRE